MAAEPGPLGATATGRRASQFETCQRGTSGYSWGKLFARDADGY